MAQGFRGLTFPLLIFISWRFVLVVFRVGQLSTQHAGGSSGCWQKHMHWLSRDCGTAK